MAGTDVTGAEIDRIALAPAEGTIVAGEQDLTRQPSGRTSQTQPGRPP